VCLNCILGGLSWFKPGGLKTVLQRRVAVCMHTLQVWACPPLSYLYLSLTAIGRKTTFFLKEQDRSSAFQLRGKEFRSTRTKGEKGPHTPAVQPRQESKAQHTNMEAK